MSHKHTHAKGKKGTHIDTNTGASEGGAVPDWTCGGGQTVLRLQTEGKKDVSILAVWEQVKSAL